MMISKNMNAAINEQIGYEFGASLQYVAIGSHFIGESLHALAAHFYRQAEEERAHAMRFVKYLLKVVQLAGKNLLFVEEYVARRKSKAEAGGKS